MNSSLLYSKFETARSSHEYSTMSVGLIEEFVSFVCIRSHAHA